MKTIAYLILLMFVFAGAVAGESYRTTVADMYARSYADQIGGQPGGYYSAAEVRAEAYRRMYEKCDEHHNCTNITAGTEIEPAEKSRAEKMRDEKTIPFIPAPVWM